MEFTEEWYSESYWRTLKLLHPIRHYLSGSALDVGTCHGAALEVMTNYGCRATGAEINDNYIAWCRDKGFAVEKMQKDSPLPFEDNSFDCLLSSHVLEHVTAPSVFLAELRRVVKPRGVVIIVVPNTLNIRAEGTFAVGHVNYFDPANIYFSARAAGLQPELITTDLPLASRTKFNLPLTPGDWSVPWKRQLLTLLPSIHRGLNLYCVTRKVDTAGPLGRKNAFD